MCGVAMPMYGYGETYMRHATCETRDPERERARGTGARGGEAPGKRRREFWTGQSLPLGPSLSLSL